MAAMAIWGETWARQFQGLPVGQDRLFAAVGDGNVTEIRARRFIALRQLEVRRLPEREHDVDGEQQPEHDDREQLVRQHGLTAPLSRQGRVERARAAHCPAGVQQ